MTNKNAPRISVEELKIKEDVESSFLIKHLHLVEAKDGRNYLNVILTDKTGDIESRAWHSADEILAKVAKGDVVWVKGKINPYQGRKQFIINKIEKLNADQFDLNDFLTASAQNSDEMFKKLENVVAELNDVYIRELLQLILGEPEVQRRLKLWQAGKSIHHAYQGGLLEHILSCCELAKFLSFQYKTNLSYVIAGCILHDLCKIYELTDGLNVDYTEEGRLVGHLVKGVELVEKYSYKIKDFPHAMKLHLKHILLSHHGEYAYGSPKVPQTREAMLVHLIDLMDSRMGIFQEIISKDNQAGHWSGYVKHLDRIIFKDELPTYSEKISSEEKERPAKKQHDSELKQNLGSLLKDFQVKK